MQTGHKTLATKPLPTLTETLTETGRVGRGWRKPHAEGWVVEPQADPRVGRRKTRIRHQEDSLGRSRRR